MAYSRRDAAQNTRIILFLLGLSLMMLSTIQAFAQNFYGINAPLLTSQTNQLPSFGEENASPRTKNVREDLFNAVAGLVGLPGMADSSQNLNNSAILQRAGFYPESATPTFLSHENGSGLIYAGNDLANPADTLINKTLNYGNRTVNKAAEGLASGLFQSPYGGARAHLNFAVNRDGKVNGEGNLFLPWHDSKYTTAYNQIGLRSVRAEDTRNRWIGNLGIGQRWYPRAVNDGIGDDAGDLMLGYNLFYDHDFSRSHQRGGIGLETQFDWLHLASNFYLPISGWKDSQDFDGSFVQERPAKGGDVRAKGYLPHYRNLALIGAYTRWSGDHVGMFGASRLEKTPGIWSAGIEYTPIQILTLFLNQRVSEHGRNDTEAGVRLVFNLDEPWGKQTNSRTVAKQRTVGGSRHEFVDRENRMILEYRAKNNYQVEYLGMANNNTFKFRVLDAFGKLLSNQEVLVRAGRGLSLAEAPIGFQGFFTRIGHFITDTLIRTAHAGALSRTYTTDSNGEFVIILDTVISSPASVTVYAGSYSREFILDGAVSTALTSMSEESAPLIAN